MIYPFLKIFFKSNFFKVHLVISGSHLEKNFGLTLSEIKDDRVKIHTKIKVPLKTNKLENAAEYFNLLQKKINQFLKRNPTDIVFLSSDRFETFAFAVSSYLRKIPIIHYEGGDVTEGGALDDNIRHAITKISNIHLTSNEDSLKRIIKMGEEKWRCSNVGYSQMHLIQNRKFDLKDIKTKFFLDVDKPLILFNLNPIIKNKDKDIKEVDEIFKALEYFQRSSNNYYLP